MTVPVKDFPIYTAEKPGDEADGKFIIYLAINTKNNKFYVGQTTYKLKDRWRSHINRSRQNRRYYLHQAIEKYGVQAFEVWELYRCTSQEEADMMEKFFIFSTRSNNRKFGYNLTEGGQGIGLSEEDKIRRTQSMPRGEKHWTSRNGISEVSRKRMSEAQRKRPPWTDEMRARHQAGIDKWMKTKPEISAETRRRMSEAAKRRCASKREERCPTT